MDSYLEDATFTVPAVPHAETGVAWLRSHVARFSEEEEHARRRALTEKVLSTVSIDRLCRPGSPVATLALELGMPRTVAADIALVADCYFPHTQITRDADAAIARLVDTAGGKWDEVTAARIGLLVQTCAATRAMILGRTPPIPNTRRIAPNGEEVVVDLTGRPFGAGRHACLGREHALALVGGALSFHRLHDGPEPLLLPQAWDLASARALVAAGFAALGINVGDGRLPEGGGSGREHAIALAGLLAQLPVPVTIDVGSGLGAEPAELGAELSNVGAAGVTIQDRRNNTLIPIEEQQRAIAGLKQGAPELFVIAAVNTHRLGAHRDHTLRRCDAYASAGADGVSVPSLSDESEIGRLVEALQVPVEVSSDLPFDRLRELGVRRVSARQ